MFKSIFPKEEDKYQGENPLRCTTHDEKGLVLIAVLFYPIF